MVKSEQAVDVICQHKRDGTLIPIKIRLKDEDEVYQEFVIKSYRVISHSGQYTLPGQIPTTSHRWVFECKINVLERERRSILFCIRSSQRLICGDLEIFRQGSNLKV